MASLVWVGDLGNHVMNKANSESPGSESGYINNGCSSESREAISPIWNSDEYQSDGTQMEKVIRIKLKSTNVQNKKSEIDSTLKNIAFMNPFFRLSQPSLGAWR